MGRFNLSWALWLASAAPALAQDVTPPTVTAMTPVPGSNSTTAPSSIVLTLSEAIDSASVSSDTVLLIRSGGDGAFSDGNEVAVVPASVSLSAPNEITVDLSGTVLPNDVYQVTLGGYGPGFALSFDGTDDFVTASQWLSGTGNTVTMECWVKPTGSGTSDGPPIIHRADFNDSYLAWAIATSTFEFSISLNEKATSLTETFNLGTWYHLAGTYDGSTVRLYIDGVSVGTHSVSKTINWDTGYFGSYIGGNGHDVPNKFMGEVDEVRIWNVARTAAQIQGARKRQLSGLETGLLAYYRTNEGAGQTVQDRSPAARNGVLGNSAAAEANDPSWVASTVPLSGIVDLAGNLLDGEFVAAFPSGQGTAGGDFVAVFTLSAPPLSPTPTALSFAAFRGGQNPATQSLSFDNPTSQVVAWTATSPASWLSLSPTSGGVSASGTQSIDASVDTTGLSLGVYTTQITLTATGLSNSPQTIDVTLRIRRAPSGKSRCGLSGLEVVAALLAGLLGRSLRRARRLNP